MKKLALALVAVLCAGCGGGGGGDNPGHAPAITNLNYSPSSVQLNEGGGTVLVAGTADFTDSGGDVASFTIETYDALGRLLSSTTTPVFGIEGQTSGVVAVEVSVPTTVAGDYTFQVLLTDAANYPSNRLSGTFNVVGGGGGPGSPVTPTGSSPSRLVHKGGELFWSEAGENPVNKISVSGGSAVALAMKVEFPASVALHETDMFWLEARSGVSPSGCVGGGVTRRLYRSSGDGRTTVLLGTDDDCAGGTTDLVVSGTDVYWVTSTASPNTYVLRKTPMSGGSATPLVTSTVPIVAMAADAANLYWMENNDQSAGGAVRRMPLGGGPVVTLASGFTSRGDTFALNGDSIFYSVANFPGTDNLVKVSLTGGYPDLLATLSSTPVKLVADNTELYWADGATIAHMPAAGGGPALLASTASAPQDIVVRAGDVVWTEEKTVKSVPKTGGSPAVLVQGEGRAFRLGMNASWLYWTEGSAGRIARAASGGGTAATVVSGIASESPPIAVSDLHVFVADNSRIKKIPLAGGMPETVASGSYRIKDLVTDGASVYWVADDVFSNVYKAPVGGGAATLLGTVPSGAIAGPVGPIRLQDGIVYWMTHYDAIVSVPAAGGTSQVVASGLPFLNDFVVEGANIYFSENDTGKIRKMSLAGDQFSDLASESPMWSPTMLTTDGQNLYWINQRHVAKIPVAGGTGTTIFEPGTLDPYTPGAVAFDTGFVYWTDPVNRVIRKAPK